jgi:hypothetical protein
VNVRETPEHLRVPAAHVPGTDQPNPADVHMSCFPSPCTLVLPQALCPGFCGKYAFAKIVERTTILAEG